MFENSFLQSARPTLQGICPKISQRNLLRLLILEQIPHKPIHGRQLLILTSYMKITFQNTAPVPPGDDEALIFMNKGYVSADIVTQCKRLDDVGISYNFFYLTGISGAGRGEFGAKATAAVCNQLRPQIIGASMLTIYPNSELYEEIQKGTWKEEQEIEKYKELKTFVENLNIPVWFAAMGASNAIPIQGTLPEDTKKVINVLEQIIGSVDESELRHYRKNLRHL